MATQFCSQCGSKLANDAGFCSTCGSPVKQPVSRERAQPAGKRRPPAKRSSAPLPLILLATGAIVLLVAGFLLLSNSSSPASPAGSAAALPDSHNEEGIPYPDVPRISVVDTKAGLDAGTVLVVDVRSQGEYQTAHIPDAISLPLTDLETRAQELPADVEIVTYCT